MAVDTHITPEQLREWLRVMKSEGCQEVTWGDFRVVFSAGSVEDAQPVIPNREPKVKRETNSIWHDPNLWPGGRPPSFPTE